MDESPEELEKSTEWIFQGYPFFSSDGWSTDQTYEAWCAVLRCANLAGGEAASWGSPDLGDWKGAASGGGRAAKCPPRCPRRLQKVAWIWSGTLGSGGIAKITKSSCPSQAQFNILPFCAVVE